ncbi:glucokinase [Legionella gratiana]|uniref:Glucokinase n=1 Tax=Legionella gratiana TaxID=45066 RepID=A0A378J4R3_9GAMM|nr:glucokinase [Legionella gratiana]KTD05915.1 glucokinase [Legionella gratiana]STX42396.1 glucokinase [Legionella gratiana]
MSFNYSTKSYAIVADIGGTFARFACVRLENLAIDKVEIYTCAAFSSLEAVLLTYQEQYKLQEIKQVVIAIACPVFDDMICMTNTHWRFSISALKQKLNLTELKVLNDFNAIAMSLPALSAQQVFQIGRGTANKDSVRAVLGAGTGLGVAYLISNELGYSAYAGEGGHVSWGAKTDQEWFIYCYLKKQYAHISYERLLSGHGLENLYQALAALNQKDNAPMPAAQIIAMALAKQCAIAEAAVAQFFAILGSYAGDLALTFAAFGGIYIAGGIVPRLISLLHHSDFRVRFEEKGRFSEFNIQIPTFIITAEQPGILGAAVYLKQSLARSREAESGMI